MKRTYSLFMATDELLTCPEIYRHAKQHNLILTPNTVRTISMVTPLDTPLGNIEQAHVSYDPLMVNVSMVHIMQEQALLYITITLCSLDVGTTDLVLHLPEATGSPLVVASAFTE